MIDPTDFVLARIASGFGEITDSVERHNKIIRQKEDEAEFAKSIHVVQRWINDDEELRIPSNEFGRELHAALSLLITVSKAKGLNRDRNS